MKPIHHSQHTFSQHLLVGNTRLCCAVLLVLLAGNLYTRAQESCASPSFAPPVNYLLGNNRAFGLTSGDFNGDGLPDLVVRLGHDSISVLLAKTSSSFGGVVAANASGGIGVGSIVTGDFNRDGKLDVAIANNTGVDPDYVGNIGVLLGKGDGNFAPVVTFPTGGRFIFGFGEGDVLLVTEDFNQDSKPDLAFAQVDQDTGNAGNIGVLLGKGDGNFAPVVTFPTGDFAGGPIVTGDFDGNNKPDLVFRSSSGIGVRLNEGDGRFGDVVNYTIDMLPTSLTTADFNSDGKLDLTVFTWNCGRDCYGGNIDVLLGDGRGGFTTSWTYPFTDEILLTSATSADFNRDGQLDLAFTKSNAFSAGGAIGVLLGHGDGSFAEPWLYLTDNSLSSMTTGDFDKDKLPDLTFINGTAVSVFLNRCDAGSPYISGFSLVNASSEQDIQELKEGDVLDLTKLPKARLNIRANTAPSTVGSVVFALSGAKTYTRVENDPPFALFGDRAGGNYYGSNLPQGDYTLSATAYSGKNGTGPIGAQVIIHFSITYQAAVTGFILVNAQTGEDIRELKHTDTLKLLTLPYQKVSIRASTDPDTVGSVVFTLSGQQFYRHRENYVPYALFGGDKHYTPLRLKAGNYKLMAIPYSAREGGGTMGTQISTIHVTVIGPEDSSACFAPPMTYASGYKYYDSQSLTQGDFNGDGALDLAVADEDSLGVLLGDGKGGFAKPRIYSSGSFSSSSLVTVDFNGDGKLDLAVADGGESISVLLNKGDGRFPDPVMYPAGGSYAVSLATGDFNGDSKPDLAVTHSGTNTIGVLLNKGDGRFADPVTYPSGGNEPRSLTVGDFNGDGKLDLAAGNVGGEPEFIGSLGVLFGEGDGRFADPVTYPKGFSDPSLATGDFNGDGKLDLASVESFLTGIGGYGLGGGGVIGLWINKGDGSFAKQVLYASGGWSAVSLASGDFNGDAKLDIAVALSEDNRVSVLLGNGMGGFSEPVTYASGGNYPISLTAGDFNRDGKLDLAANNRLSQVNIAVLLNQCSTATLPALTEAGARPRIEHAESAQAKLNVSPNPFSSESLVRFSVKKDTHATLSVYDQRGTEIARLFAGRAEREKPYQVSFVGKGLPAGVYLLRLTTVDGELASQKVVLVR